MISYAGGLMGWWYALMWNSSIISLAISSNNVNQNTNSMLLRIEN